MLDGDRHFRFKEETNTAFEDKQKVLSLIEILHSRSVCQNLLWSLLSVIICQTVNKTLTCCFPDDNCAISKENKHLYYVCKALFLICFNNPVTKRVLWSESQLELRSKVTLVFWGGNRSCQKLTLSKCDCSGLRALC